MQQPAKTDQTSLFKMKIIRLDYGESVYCQENLIMVRECIVQYGILGS